MKKLADSIKAKSPAFQRARLGSLPYNLVRSGQLQKYYQTLTDFNFVIDKIQHHELGVQALITDYDLIDNPEASTQPEYNKAISGSSDRTLKVWNLETGETIATFTGESALLCCAVAPDGVTIVAGEESGRVHFLRLEGGNGCL